MINAIVFAPMRCKLVRGFMNMALKFEDSQPPTDSEIGARLHSIESFIEFIVTDITIPEHARP